MIVVWQSAGSPERVKVERAEKFLDEMDKNL
jgi:hypothetical protein